MGSQAQGRLHRLEGAGVIRGREGRLCLFSFALFCMKKQVEVKSRVAFLCSRAGFQYRPTGTVRFSSVGVSEETAFLLLAGFCV